MDLKDFTENEQEEIEKGLSKFISKQSVSIWYALTPVYPYELDSHDCGCCLFSCVE